MPLSNRPLFSRLQSIPQEDPTLTPENWCQAQPCAHIRIGAREIRITQPQSTFWVYLLGILTIGAGLYFFQIAQGDNARWWWGMALLLWGIGALLAGTSYQAFGYQIKCAGRPVCAWTSWWEVVYLMFQQVSVNGLLVALAYSSTTGVVQRILLDYALASSVIYVILALVGGLVPIKSLITFEGMVWVSTPAFVIFCLVNGWRYLRFGEAADLALLGGWIILLVTMLAYWLYMRLGISRRLWARGIWFSENDVLHVLLIGWVIYLVTAVAGQVQDLPVG
jgi:hypothetical protein